jgi:hypothetical protein
MNLLRTIQRTEQQRWIRTLFTPGPHTGKELQPVKPGDTVVIRGIYAHMPTLLQQVEVRGFMGPRYTNQGLHTLSPSALRKALVCAGITVY